MSSLFEHTLALAKDPDARIKLKQLLEELHPDKFRIWFSEEWSSLSHNQHLEYLDAIIMGSPEGNFRRDIVLEFIIDWLIGNSNEQVGRLAVVTINALIPELNSISPKLIVQSITKIASLLKAPENAQRSIFELLPKLLQSLAHPSKPFKVEGMDSIQFKNFMIDRMFSSKWDLSVTLAIAKVFREMDLSANQVIFAIKKTTSQFDKLPCSDLPDIVYQLLLFPQQANKMAVLEAVASYFDDIMFAQGAHIERSSKGKGPACEPLEEAKGSIMMHFVFSLKQDRVFVENFMKSFKSFGKALKLSPFKFAILLAISSVFCFEQQALDVCRYVVQSIYSVESKSRRINGGQKLFPDGRIRYLNELLNHIALRIEYGWDPVVQGLQKLCFFLIDSSNTIATASTPEDESKTTDNVKIVASAFCLLLYRSQPIFRAELLDSIILRISGQNQGADLLVGPFSAIIKEESGRTIKMLSVKFRGLIESVVLMPINLAESILEALAPVIAKDLDLKRHYLACFRKGLFCKAENGRLVAVSAMLKLVLTLANDEIDESAQALLLEILPLLRRCFTQQPHVRAHLYKWIIRMSDFPRLALTLLPVIFHQFLRYFESDARSNCPIITDSLIDNSSGRALEPEPLALLLKCLVIIVRNCPSGDSNVDNCCKVLQEVMSRLEKTTLEDIDLDENSDFSPKTAAGSKNCIILRTVCGVYETLMQYQLECHKMDLSKINGLFEKYFNMVGVCKKALKTAREPYRFEVGDVMMRSLMPLFDRINVEGTADFVTFAYDILAEKARDTSTSRSLKISITKILITKLIEFLQPHSRSLDELQTACVAASVDFIISIIELYGEELTIFEVIASELQAIGNKVPPAQNVFQFLLNVSLKVNNSRAQKLLGRLFKIYNSSILSVDERSSIEKLCFELCKKGSVTEINSCKALVRLLGSQTCGSLGNLIIISKDIFRLLGKFEVETDELAAHNSDRKQDEIMPIVSERTASVLSAAILQSMDEMLDDLNTIMALQKIYSAAGLLVADDERKIEALVRDKMIDITKCLAELMQCPLYEIADSIFRSLVKLFKNLTSLTKLYCSLDQPKDDLEQLISSASGKLTSQIYSFISYINQVDMEQSRQCPDKTNSIVRKTKAVPSLIFNIEQFETQLMRLSKKSGNDFTRFCKRSVARDFRIQVNLLEEADENVENYIGDRDNTKEPESDLKKQRIF